MGSLKRERHIMKIVDYRVIDAYSAVGLNYKVNDYLLAGYELYGLPFVYENTICQAIIKRNDTPRSVTT